MLCCAKSCRSWGGTLGESLTDIGGECSNACIEAVVGAALRRSCTNLAVRSSTSLAACLDQRRSRVRGEAVVGAAVDVVQACLATGQLLSWTACSTSEADSISRQLQPLQQLASTNTGVHSSGQFVRASCSQTQWCVLKCKGAWLAGCASADIGTTAKALGQLMLLWQPGRIRLSAASVRQLKASC